MLHEVFCPQCRLARQVDDENSEKDSTCPFCHTKEDCPCCGKSVYVHWRTCPYCEAALIPFRNDQQSRSVLKTTFAGFGVLGLMFWFMVLVLNLIVSNLWFALIEVVFVMWLIGLSAGFHYYRRSRDETQPSTLSSILYLALVCFGALNAFTCFCFCPVAYVILPDPFR